MLMQNALRRPLELRVPDTRSRDWESVEPVESSDARPLLAKCWCIIEIPGQLQAHVTPAKHLISIYTAGARINSDANARASCASVAGVGNLISWLWLGLPISKLSCLLLGLVTRKPMLPLEKGKGQKCRALWWCVRMDWIINLTWKPLKPPSV